MREVQIGSQTVRLRGSPLSLLYYQQEFGRDLLGDLVGMVTGMAGLEALKSGKVDLSKINFAAIDSIAILRLIWTLARTDAGPTGKFPSFKKWLEENEDISLFDEDLLTAAIEEATKAFFRSKQTVAPTAQGRRSK